MECNPEGLSVLGYPILSDYNYEQERGQGAGAGSSPRRVRPAADSECGA